MAPRQALAKGAFGATRVSLAPPSSVMTEHQTIVPPNAAQVNFRREYLTSTDTPRKGFFRPFLHRQSASKLPKFLTVPVGEKLREKLKGTNISGEELRLGGLSPPPPDRDPTAELPFGISVRNAKRILRLPHVDKLREIPETSISRSQFVRICSEGCESEEQGAEFAKMMDESVNVIVLGNVVFLLPEQVAKSMESIISQSMPIPNDPRRKELHQMETQKMLIDQKGRALVRGELYCGLGFFVISNDRGHAAHFLGAELGCHGAHLLLRHLHPLRLGLRLLSPDIDGAHFPRVLPPSLHSQATAAHGGS